MGCSLQGPISLGRRVGAGPDESLHRGRVRTVLSEEYFTYYSQKNFSVIGLFLHVTEDGLSGAHWSLHCLCPVSVSV